jgi:hypothetical protein
MEVSWKEMVVEDLSVEPPTARGRDALEINTGGRCNWIHRAASRRLCATALQVALAHRAAARQNPPFVFQQQFLFTAPGDLQPPGRPTHSMNRFLNT